MAKGRGINLDSDEVVAEGLLSDEAEVEDVSTLPEEVEAKNYSLRKLKRASLRQH